MITMPVYPYRGMHTSNSRGIPHTQHRNVYRCISSVHWPSYLYAPPPPARITTNVLRNPLCTAITPTHSFMYTFY